MLVLLLTMALDAFVMQHFGTDILVITSLIDHISWFTTITLYILNETNYLEELHKLKLNINKETPVEI